MVSTGRERGFARPGFTHTQPRRDFDGGRRFDNGRDFDNGRRFDNGRGFDNGHRFDNGRGFDNDHRFDNRRHWEGGFWHGRFWPGAYYRPGFVRFCSVLPGVYSTFWFGGVSYYYANDLYYTWSPRDYGYVVTDPPPLAASAPSDNGAADEQSGGSASVYVYPRNGQSEEQVATDRYECHQWAVSQTGFDPTRGSDQPESASSASDYRRAMIACLDARGYSAN
jgi:hypothetical protein